MKNEAPRRLSDRGKSGAGERAMRPTLRLRWRDPWIVKVVWQATAPGFAAVRHAYDGPPQRTHPAIVVALPGEQTGR